MAAAVNAPSLEIDLLMGVRIRLGGDDLAVGGDVAHSLLGYLSLTEGFCEDRARLSAILWEDTDESGARAQLRQIIHRLRAVLGEGWPGFMADRTTVALDPAYLTTDVGELVREIEHGRTPDALLRTPNLPEGLMATTPERGGLWASWLRHRRRALENTLLSGLERISETAQGAEAIRACRALMMLDPANEAAARTLIRIHADAGDMGRALGVYAQLWRHLDEEFDVEPSKETQTLIAALKAGRDSPSTFQDPPTSGGSGRRLGVSALAAPADAGEPAMKARLFRAELVSRLSRFREMDVLDLSTVDQAVDYRLALDVAPSPGDSAAVASFTRSKDGRVLWSESFLIDGESWWAHQAEIAGRIASACNIHLSRARLGELSTGAGRSDAIDAWILGNASALGFREASWRAAETQFRASIGLDPDFALGYASLAQLLNIEHLARPGVIRRRETHREARRLANQAIALDPWEARAHLHRGWASALLDEHDQACASFTMAQRCTPYDPWITISCALGFAFADVADEAWALVARMEAFGWITSPQHWGYVATIAFVLEDPVRAKAAAENAGDAILNLPAWRAAALWELGDVEAARDAWAAFEAAVASHWRDEAGAPKKGDARAWLLSCFPIRSERARTRFAAAVRGASGAGD